MSVNPDNVALREGWKRRSLILLAAFAPLLALFFYTVTHANFALIDDGMTLLSSSQPPMSYFHIGDSGRFVPLYWLTYWTLFKLLPMQPWAMALGNGLFMLGSGYLVYRLANLLSGAIAAIVAVWLFSFNLAAIENFFTYGKAEPRQLLFWLIALELLIHASRNGLSSRSLWPSFWLVLMTLCACMSKETAFLLAVPLLLHGLMVFMTRDGAIPWRSLLLPLVGLVTIALFLIPVALHNMAPGTYARSHVIGEGFHWAESAKLMLSKNSALSALVAVGLVVGGWLSFSAIKGTWATLLLWSQLAAVVLFLSLVKSQHPYYLLPAAALSAVLIPAALQSFSTRFPGRVIAWSLTGLLLAAGAAASLTGAATLTGWSWLYGQLTAAVIKDRPTRVLFHVAGNPEVHAEAGLTWNHLNRVPVSVGLLNTPANNEPDQLHVSYRELRPGDWIIEQFGSPYNIKIPFRDLRIARPVDFALLSNSGVSVLPLKLHARFAAHYPAFGHSPFLPKSFLEWRIYEVTSEPVLVFEGLDEGRWMFAESKIWIKATQVKHPLQLRMRPFVPPDGKGNRLHIYSGDREVADCPTTQGIAICEVPPKAWAGPRDAEGWVELRLRAEYTYCPLELGISADPRHFSFNFEPSYQAGLDGLLALPE